MRQDTVHFIRLMRHPVKFRLFLFYKLPSAFFSGVRMKKLDEQACVTVVPYKWFSQNPFRSTYFACLGMAAEMSTGMLVMAHSFKSHPPISMLVIKMESNYFKKAIGLTSFVCEDGTLIREALEKAMSSGEAQLFTARSTGTSSAGERVAEFLITWSCKAKQNK